MTDDLRDRTRCALAETDGFDYDHLEPHNYQRHADAILALFQLAIGATEPRRYDYPIGDPLPASNTCGHSAEFHGPEAGCVECRCTSTVGHE